MRKNFFVLLLTMCFLMTGSFAGSVFAASSGADTLYYFDDNHRTFDLHGMSYVEGLNADADFGVNAQGSSWYFSMRNGAAMQDLGAVDYATARVPASGYSSERTYVKQDHVYAIRCGEGTYGILKVTYYDAGDGSVEFMARLGEPEDRVDLYFMDYDNKYFDFQAMKTVPPLNTDGDLGYKPYTTPYIFGINGSSVQDLGAVDFAGAKAPSTGYKTTDIKLLKDHVYAIRCGGSGFYIIKVTNVVSEAGFEFIAKKGEAAASGSGSSSAGSTGGNSGGTSSGKSSTGSNSGGSVSKDDDFPTVDDPEDDNEPVGGDEDKPHVTDRAKVTELYWVENEVMFVLGGKILFKDDNGIYAPVLSYDKKFVAYSNGEDTLYLYDISKKVKKTLFSLKSADYRIYPTGWSPDGKQVAFRTSYSGGYTGGNQVGIVTVSTKKASYLAKGLCSADWGKNGKFAIANGTQVWTVDKLGRSKTMLNVPTANAFYGSDDVSITPDCTKVIYIVADTYYLHDLKTNKYAALAIPEDAAKGGTIHMGQTGKIAVLQGGAIYIYDPKDGDYSVLYSDAECSYPNWINR